MAAAQSTESTRAYFRRIYAQNPSLVWERSNQPLLDQWKRDHRQDDVPANIKLSLSNTKSELRAELRDGGDNPVATRASKPGRGSDLEQLEVAIDTCLQVARQHKHEDMERVVHLLHRARNRVVHELAETGQD